MKSLLEHRTSRFGGTVSMGSHRVAFPGGIVIRAAPKTDDCATATF